jgi:hypothetical protein
LKAICEKFADKIKVDIKKLLFLYGGEILNQELSFKDKADMKKKQMKILVCDINENSNVKDKEKEELEKEIEKMKVKLNEILSKYLGDRKYVVDKIDNWRDAIMNDCESFFSFYKNKYKIFTNLVINDKNEKGDYMGDGANLDMKIILKSHLIQVK